MSILYDESTDGCLQEQVIMERIVMADGILTSEIPGELKQMPESMKETFYPYEDRPEMIFSDADGKRQMSFQLIDKKLRKARTGKIRSIRSLKINTRRKSVLHRSPL